MAVMDWEAAIDRLIGRVENEDHAAVLREYDTEMKAGGLKATSRLRTLYPLRDFAAFLGEKPFLEATRKDVVGFLAGLDKKPEKPKTVLRGFLPWLAKSAGVDGLAELAEDKLLAPNRNASDGEVTPDELLSRDDVRAMVEAADHPRDKALVVTLYETGATHDECLAMNVGHVRFDRLGAKVAIRPGVRNHQQRDLRLVDAVPYLQTWLECHPNREGDLDETPLWVSFDAKLKKGEPRPRLASSSLSVLLKGLAERAGLGRDAVWPHLFRHSRATEVANRGWNEAQMRTWFGWSKTSRMPSRYVHMTGADAERRQLADHGVAVEPEAEDPLAPRHCPRCKTENEATNDYCRNCGMALTEDAALNGEASLRASVKEEVEADLREKAEKYDELVGRVRQMESLLTRLEKRGVFEALAAEPGEAEKEGDE